MRRNPAWIVLLALIGATSIISAHVDAQGVKKLIIRNVVSQTKHVAEVEKQLGWKLASRSTAKPVAKLVSNYELPVRKTQLISALPRNSEEFKRVYGKPASKGDLSDISEVKKELFKVTGAVINPPKNLDDFSLLVRQSDADTIGVVGHSEEAGQVIKLPSGAAIRHDSLVAACNRAGKRCIVLTCHSPSVEISFDIPPVATISAWRETSEWLIDHSDVPYPILVRRIRGKLIASKNTCAIGYVIAAGAGVYFIFEAFDEPSIKVRTTKFRSFPAN